MQTLGIAEARYNLLRSDLVHYGGILALVVLIAAALTVANILLTLFTFVRLIAISPALPYYVLLSPSGVQAVVNASSGLYSGGSV